MVDARHPAEAAGPMKYHLHARLFEGSLYSPARNELQSGESDDREEITTLAKELVTRGFSVWVYVHDPVQRLPNGEGQYRVVAEWNCHGERVK